MNMLNDKKHALIQFIDFIIIMELLHKILMNEFTRFLYSDGEPVDQMVDYQFAQNELLMNEATGGKKFKPCFPKDA